MHFIRLAQERQARGGLGSVLIWLERGWVVDQPQRCDWCFAHSRAPGNSKSGHCRPLRSRQQNNGLRHSEIGVWLPGNSGFLIRPGYHRSSRPDFARFVEIATGSLFEVISQATVARRQAFLSEADYSRLYSACEKQSKMLSGLRKSLLSPSS